MTLEEKASLTSGKSFWETMNIDRLGIPSIFLADGPHGVRKQMASADHLGLNESYRATCYPTAATTANSWNPDLLEIMGESLGREAVVQKVNVLLGPGINIKRNPRCGRNFEYFSEDPYLAGKLSAAFVRGVQSNGISACLKHFAANNQEERRMVLDSIIDERTYREIYLTAFEIAVKEGKAKTIMTSYNRINGVYANESMHLLQEILRKEWGFTGVIVTDWGGNNDRIEALIAGNELEMPTTGGETNREIVAAVKDGKIPESLLDEVIERLLMLVFDTETVFKEKAEPFDVEKHHDIARKVCEDSIVLLKNEGGILPLKSGTNVAVIGDFAKVPRYQGAGSSVVNTTKLEGTIENITKYDLKYIGYEPGFQRFGKKSKSLIQKALQLAEKADVILLYVGLDEATETEGLDRSNIKLPDNQVALVKALKSLGKTVVAVLSCGSCIEMGFADDVQAVVHATLGGQAVAKAVLNVITGLVNPSGKLSESYPLSYADVPSASNFPGKEKTIEYREGPYIGYRYYDTAGVPVRYPFGFGLSYTTFEYSKLSVDEKGVTFTLKNTGIRGGAETAQLYIGSKNGKIFRPKKELKGFAKIYLEPLESKEVFIPFDDYTFRYFNQKTNRFEVEGCTYNIMVGASSADIRLSAELEQTGTGAENPYRASKLPSYYSGKASNVGEEEFTELYGRELPDPHYSFIKKKRMLIDYNTTISELKYARGWTGRFLAWGIRFAYKFFMAFGNHKMANMLMMGMFHMPMRGLSRMTGGAISWDQLGGLLIMFNGKFFKGFGVFRIAGKAKKKRIKAEKLAQKQGNAD